MEVTVYTKPGCHGCNATIRRLNEKQIPYETKPLDESMRPVIEAHQLRHAPVVQAGDMYWDGYRPDRIDALR